MTRRTYYAPPAEPAPAEEPRDGVLWGYTMRDLERATRMALARNVGVSAFARAERYDIAWSAIALTVCEATEKPTLSDLASAGWYAIAEARSTEMRHHGVDSTRRIGETRRSFATYWRPTVATSHEERVVERVALGQVWPRLTDAQRDHLTALAVHGTATAAAAAMGRGHSAFHKTARAGRNEAKRLWWGDETPVTWGRDRRGGADSRGSWTQVRRRIRRRAA
jgi:hypothetical protein